MKIHGRIQDRMFSNMRELYRQFNKLDGEQVTVSISKRKAKRTLKQNAYMWSVVYAVIGDWIGDTVEAVHEEYDEILDLRKYVDENGKRKVKRTSQMTTDELSAYIEKLKLWAWHNHQLYIPEANEQETVHG